MLSVTMQSMSTWILIMLCTVYIKAEEPRCYYMDLERRLSEKIEDVISRNEEIMSRLFDINEHLMKKADEDISYKSPPFHNVLSVADLEYDNWKMVFRATAGNGHNVFDAWTQGKGACNTKPKTMERSLSCHYRSNLVNRWNSLRVTLVKFALYDQDKEVAHVIFNGAGTDLSTWFDKTKIVSSSWSDVTSAHNFNHCSVHGYSTGSIDRRFHINRHYGGCDKDMGHMVTIDTKTRKACGWDSHVVYPQFLYSKINSADLWEVGHYGRADYMAIFIKTTN